MKIKVIENERIVFDNGYKLEYYHKQDCCEQVYADFEVLETYNVSIKTGKSINIKEIDFRENLSKLVEGVEGLGFNMISKIGEKFFIPCYNDQNGYYSNELELILHTDNSKETLDITNFIKDTFCKKEVRKNGYKK